MVLPWRLILKEMGLENCKGSDVIGAVADVRENDVKLERRDARLFRSLAARCNFLSSDRTHIQYACKEICRRMSEPCVSDWVMIKKLARHFKFQPRQVCMFCYQDMPRELSVIVDTDYGGCRRTRRSTNSGLAMLGNHVIKSWSSTQTVVALSSGEAEYYGVTKGACEGIGIAGLIADLGGNSVKITFPQIHQRRRELLPGVVLAK